VTSPKRLRREGGPFAWLIRWRSSASRIERSREMTVGSSDLRIFQRQPWLRVSVTGSLLVVAACTARLPEPVTLPQPDVRAPTYIGRIHDYRGAAAAIAGVFERELGIPPFPVTFYFYPDRAAFERALVDSGQDVRSARDTAAAMVGVGMHGRILLNNEGLNRVSWPDRVRMLAHELVHSLQYELTGGLRGVSEQWLREGFAEWVALMTVDRLGGRPLRDLRDQQLALFRASDRSKAPRLDDMATFAQWVPLANRREIATYSQAFLAVDFLVERHGAAAIVEYFRQFTSTRDRRAAFRTVFGEEPAAFAAAVDERLGIRRRIPESESRIPHRSSRIANRRVPDP
jgi:hypothetical protein